MTTDWEQVRDTIRTALGLWDEAHRTDDAITLGAAIVGLREALERLDTLIGGAA